MNILKNMWFKIRGPKVVPFSNENYAARDIYRADYKILSRVILERISFNSVLDVGCANGFILEDFYDSRKTISGIELSADAVNFLPDKIRKFVKIGDFSLAEGSYDLVSCIEVAEHIPPVISESLVKLLISRAKSVIYFTAAPPGQPGHGHINCRPHQDWINFFEAYGWSLDRDLTDVVRRDLSEIKEARWLIGNSLIFKPRETLI